MVAMLHEHESIEMDMIREHVKNALKHTRQVCPIGLSDMFGTRYNSMIGVPMLHSMVVLV